MHKMYLKTVVCAIIYALFFGFTRPNKTHTKMEQIVVLVPSSLRVNTSVVQHGKNLKLLWIFVDKQNTSAFTLINSLSEQFCSQRTVAVIGSGCAVIDGLAAEMANHLVVPFINLKPTTKGSNVISLVPSPVSRVRAIISIAVELVCSRITVFTSHLANQMLFSDLAYQAQNIAFDFKLILLKQFSTEWEKTLQIAKEITVLNTSGSCMVVMDTNPSETQLIYKTLWSLGKSSKEFVWIVFDEPYSVNNDSFMDNSIAVRWPFTHMELMREAVSLVTKSLETAPSITRRLSVINNETDIDTKREIGRDLYRLFTSQEFQGITGKVTFNHLGERIHFKYDIVQLGKDQYGNQQWRTVGSVDNERAKFYYNFWQKTTSSSNTPLILRMVTIEEDPVTIVSKEKLKPGEECVLSKACYKYKKTKDTSGAREVERYCCSGFIFDVLDLLQQDLKFQPDIYFVEDERYGAYDTKTHTWNGMVNDVLQGKADMTLSMLTINEIRSRVVDYSPALLHSETKIMISVAPSKTTFWDFAFLDPFSRDLWVVGVAVVNAMLIILWSLDRYSPYGYYKHSFGHARTTFNIPACMSYVWGLVFKLQIDNVTPRATSARFTSLIFSFFTLVLISTYTANLAAYLVKAREDYPISDIRNKQFTDRSLGFKFATLESSSTEMLFSRSSDPTFRRIYQNMKPYQVGTYKEAISNLRSGQLDAFIDDSPYLDLAASKQSDCSFRIIGRPIRMNMLGIVFRRGSKWTEPISNLLLKYQRQDHFRKLRQKWFSGVCTNVKTTNEAFKLAVKHFGGLFLVCSASIIICAVLLLFELIWYRCLKQFITSYNVRQEEGPDFCHDIATSRTSVKELLPLSIHELNGEVFMTSRKSSTELSSFTNISTLS